MAVRTAVPSRDRATRGAADAKRESLAVSPHAWVADGRLFLRGEPVLSVADIRLPGVHNLENCLAAALAASARGVEKAAVEEGLRTFTGVAHRLESAGIVGGVTYVNDSKATNVEAALTALSAYPERTHLILGGRDKASDYRPIARACSKGCRAVYLIGEAAPLIAEAFAAVRTREGLDMVPEPKTFGDLESAVAGGQSCGRLRGRGAPGARVRQFRPVQGFRGARRSFPGHSRRSGRGVIQGELH